jgi:hypothetical protein
VVLRLIQVPFLLFHQPFRFLFYSLASQLPSGRRNANGSGRAKTKSASAMNKTKSYALA